MYSFKKRGFNKDLYGYVFTEDIINIVWENTVRKRQAVFQNDPEEGFDCYGNFILRNEYGNTRSTAGWEIDHKIPIIRGGDDSILNLRAVQWEENRQKGDKTEKEYLQEI